MATIQIKATEVRKGDRIDTGLIEREVSKIVTRKDGLLEFEMKGQAHAYSGNLGNGINPEWTFTVWRPLPR